MLKLNLMTINGTAADPTMGMAKRSCNRTSGARDGEERDAAG